MKPRRRRTNAARCRVRTFLSTAIWMLLTGTVWAAGPAATATTPTPPTQAARSAPQTTAPAPSADCARPARRQARMLDEGFIDEGVLEGTDLLEEGLEIGGLTTDQMVTKFGHDLFDAFMRYWRPPEGVSYNLLFTELADARRGSVATIRLNDQVIFEGPLAPRDEAIQELGKGLARDIRNLLRSNAQLEEEEYY